MIPDKITPEYRTALALQILRQLRSAINANGGRYSGALVPNIQSVHDCLTLSDPDLLFEVKKMPKEFLPAPERVEEVGRWWKSPASSRTLGQV
jgi:hypothetical protein